MKNLFFTSTEDLKPERPIFNYPFFQIIIALIGLGASFWTYILHIQLTAQSGKPLFCDVNETVNCSKIIGSDAGEILGVPLGILGLVYWLIVFVVIFLPKFTHASLKYISFWRRFVAGVGAISAVALAFISYFVLKGVCEFCSVIQISCIIYFILSFIDYKKQRHIEYYASKNDFIRFTYATVLAFIMPLIFFGISEKSLISYYESKSPTPVQIAAHANHEQNQEDNGPMIFQPTLDNEATDYFKGSENAPVTIIAFSDFECGYCQVLHEKIIELQKKYLDTGKVKIYMRNFPLNFHRYSFKLAIAARCAGEQEKFWEFADWAFESARIFARDEKKKASLFSPAGITNKAKILGLNVEEFNQCQKEQRITDKIKKDSNDAVSLGARGTPYLLIDSQPYTGNWMKPGAIEQAIESRLN